jgi:exosortase/archaeosortase family protein
MLTAALLVFPLPWRARLAGIAIGLVFVLGMNLLRILALFYAFRSDLLIFDYLHGILLPVVLILFTSLYCLWWTSRHAVPIVTVQTDRS